MAQIVQDEFLQIRRLAEELLNKNVDIVKRSNVRKLLILVLCVSKLMTL